MKPWNNNNIITDRLNNIRIFLIKEKDFLAILKLTMAFIKKNLNCINQKWFFKRNLAHHWIQNNIN